MFCRIFEAVINSYLAHERNRGLKENTLAGKQHALNQIFEYFEGIGLKNTQDIKTAHVYGFLDSRTYFSVTTKEHYQYILRSLIRYLFDNDACKPELLKLFPIISIHTKNAYPSYFKPSDIARILKCVDVGTAGGKRDYLVLLMAAELGMRVGDICALKIDNVNFRKKRVEYVQEKTGDSVTLPISDEMMCAFADYLKNARPKCPYDEVLVNGKAPIEPFRHKTFYGVLKKYLSEAGIDIAAGQKRGLHSLRSSLASNMLRDGVSIPVISNVLGHRYADTTSIYLKIDLDGLRKSALEVPCL